MGVKKEPTVPIVEPEETYGEMIDGEFVRVSTSPWSNRAWLRTLLPEKVQEVRFVETHGDDVAETAWVFDGLACYYREGVVYVVCGNKLKITGSMSNAFADMINLQTISGLDRVDTSEVQDMSGLFKNCQSLINADESNIETDGLITADSMFYGCTSLVNLNLSNANMKNVIDMDYVFAMCKSMRTIHLPMTANVLSFNYAFEEVGTSMWNENIDINGTEIIGSLNTDNCKEMKYMFKCSNLHDYSLAENFNTSNLQNAEGMFYDCDITHIDLSKWNTENIKTTQKMFWHDQRMKICNTIGWNVQSLENCEEMFYRCSNLNPFELGWTNVGPLHSACRMFYFCSYVPTIDISCFDGIYIGNAKEMFALCARTTTIYGKGFHSDVSDDMFYQCNNLIGAIPHSDDKIDGNFANADGYFTPCDTQ